MLIDYILFDGKTKKWKDFSVDDLEFLNRLSFYNVTFTALTLIFLIFLIII